MQPPDGAAASRQPAPLHGLLARKAGYHQSQGEEGPREGQKSGKRMVGESGQVPSKARLSKATSLLRNSVKELEFALRIPSLPPPLGAPPPTHTLQLLKCIRSILKLVTLFAK